MKKLIYLMIIMFALSFVSCDKDFLEQTPLDEISEPEFWKTAGDLELYATGFYNNLPGWGSVGNGFAANPDNNTDVSLYTTESSRLDGNTSVPTAASGSVWSFTNVRKANYFIDNMSKAEGAEADINHYKGEGYFFRAYYYFILLQSYGDVPIIDKYIDNTDTDYLYAARDPRNEVVDFMLDDLDMAISLLKSKSELTTPRLSAEAAQLFKATVALYEGTWEKYHAGTDFGVSGSNGSVYLGIAATAAKAVIDGGAFSLNSDYAENFNQLNLKSNKEIMLWREYDYLTFGKSYGNDSQIWPNRSGYTRFAMRSYLCTDGKPISVSPLYKGDLGLDSIEVNRDPRLASTVMVPGDDLVIAIDGTVTPFTGPILTSNNSCVTAYEGQKYRVVNIDASTGSVSRNLSKVIMRYAEVLLIYAEAKAELGTITQGDLDISINKLRDRVGMPHLTLGAITVDPEWPDYGYTLTDVLYEVRRERSVELMGEGFRFEDLMRWRAHELFVGQRPRGAYYEAFLKTISNKLKSDSEGYIDPFLATLGTEGYGFDPSKDYLNPLPTEELVLNENLVQNPGWE
jgi:hypothetical protein